MRKGWARIWPSLLAAVTLPAVGGPAAVASYRHARDVIAEHGDPVMAPWLALTTDGMLLAALVVIWVRRHRREPVGVGPWTAFWAGMAATIAANLAAAQSTPIGIVVALWSPVCLAITLELIALVASPTKHHPVTDTRPAEWSTHVPDHAQPVPGHDPAVTGLDDQAPDTAETRETDEPKPVPAALPAGKTPATNGHVRMREPTPPALDPRDDVDPAGQVPAPASEDESGTEPGHQAGRNGHHGPARTVRVPDGGIFAWLREQTGTTGKVPGRRTINWALGSPPRSPPTLHRPRTCPEARAGSHDVEEQRSPQELRDPLTAAVPFGEDPGVRSPPASPAAGWPQRTQRLRSRARPSRGGAGALLPEPPADLRQDQAPAPDLKRRLAAQPDQPATSPDLQGLLHRFTGDYNHRRPHHSLDRRTPAVLPRPPQGHPHRLTPRSVRHPHPPRVLCPDEWLGLSQRCAATRPAWPRCPGAAGGAAAVRHAAR
jgi:Protein of unknown function (DUF2637)/Integrase core domain